MTYITPAVDAFHLPHQGHPGVPVVAVLVVVLAKLALQRAVGLHHVCVLQPRGGLLFLGGALLAAVGRVPPDGATAGQHGTRDLLTVHLSRRALGRSARRSPSDTQLLHPLCSTSFPSFLFDVLVDQSEMVDDDEDDEGNSMFNVFTLQVQRAHLM